jgi:prepilin-type N-terminal cleavage/methylation domain-containing protein
MLKQTTQRKLKKQQGFTLLEILVVVAIMGFLVAMVAPRFAGITDGTIDVVCDTNQQRLVAALSAYNEQKGSLPSGMVNLVDFDTSTNATLRPTHTGELENPDEGQATFFEEFYERNLFEVHILNEDEADELKDLSVRAVYNLNAYNYDGPIGSHGDAHAETDPVAEGNRASALQRVDVEEGLGVLMIGMGASTTGGDLAGTAVLTTAGFIQVAGENYEEWGNPDWLGRIILGVGPDSALIKEGMISAAGLCPGGVNNEQVFWNNYNVVLPRLDATTKRFNANAETTLFAKANGGSVREFDLTEAQESFMFLTQCPEGHRFPTPEEFETWLIYAGESEPTWPE